MWTFDKWDDFNVDIVNFLFFDKDVPRSASFAAFARVCSTHNVDGFNNRNLFLLLSY